MAARGAGATAVLLARSGDLDTVASLPHCARMSWFSTPARRTAAAALAGLLAVAGGARAQDAICTDRPGKATAVCTAPAQRFQLETDLVSGSFLRQGGVTTDTYFVTNPNLKYGVSKDWDLEAQIAPYVVVRTHDKFGAGDVVGGVSDLILRAKHRFDVPSETVSVALLPFVKAPTARRGVGNGAWEGGVLLPVGVQLSPAWSLALTPELDVVKDDVGGGRHLTHVEVAALSRSLPANVVLSAELWGSWSYDPGRTVRQGSFDLTLAWTPIPSVQWDVGLNLGLTRATPGAEAYIGVAKRF